VSFRGDAENNGVWQHDMLVKQIFSFGVLTFVSGYGKHDVLRFEPIKNYEKRTRSMEVVIVAIFFRLSFLSSFFFN
jgi:hypothetical protein